ncbi:hypothetical protein SpCBS45565_g04594 [Spizellomyces sp. 'palustris']|nr:hypothetical protein SpCBS45565_g04594 [Spizellomyces sp. 'palustris']
MKYSGGFNNSPTPTIPSPTSEFKSKVFGARLEDIMGENGEKGVPRVIRDCIRFILVNGIHVEGIFRRSPSSKLLQEAKAAYDRNDEHIDLEAFGGVHLACVLLKTFFRDLPEPVFPSKIYDVIRGITACQSEKEQLEYIKNAILPLLPYPSYMILRASLRLLHQVQLHASENLMTASNLTIVWSPNLVKSENPLADFNICGMGAQGGGGGTMLKLCIERFAEVFEGEEPWEVVTGAQSEGTQDDGVELVVNTPRNSQVSVSGDGGENRLE